jgi:ketosteroid isomerase-like protein
MTALERTIARDEIRQLAYRYAFAIDSRDIDLLVSLFVPDVRVGRDRSGRDALRESWRESLSAIGVSICSWATT